LELTAVKLPNAAGTTEAGLEQSRPAMTLESANEQSALIQDFFQNLKPGEFKKSTSNVAVPQPGVLPTLQLRDAKEVLPASSVAQNILNVTAPPSGESPAQAASLQVPDIKEARSVNLAQNISTFKNLISAVMPSGVLDAAKPMERSYPKSSSGHSGSAGFEAALGQVTSDLNRSDAIFVVPPATATVADTAIAETVSYWVSHGLQSAEMTLDGFGETPVQVNIVLNGDLAQIDFRTDHSGVRQILENATTQLRDLLSGQGLQLSGVSVGTSGQGASSGDSRQSRQERQQITLVKEAAVNPLSSGAKHPSVGRSLDLFV
jgi:hypothetical protein